MVRVAALLIFAGCVSCSYDFENYLPRGKTDSALQSDTPTGGCSEAGSRTYGGHCYFPTTAALSWQDAKRACEAAGSHLAVITTANEQAAIESMASGSDRWIGLSRPVGSASDVTQFKWVTGEAPSYFKWDAGEPSGAGECSRMKRSGAWGDNSCAALFVALCERESS